MASSRKIIGLIVAAGYSKRMGMFKPLLPLGDKTVIETAVDSLRQGGIQDIRVVTGYQAERLNSVLGGLSVQIIDNPRYAEGMFSSVLAGLDNMEADTEAFLMLPGDNPLIRRRSVKDILRTYRETGATVVYPVFDGKRGHPPLISAKCFSSIRCSDGTGGLRNILDRFAADSVEVDVADQGILIDIDTVDDYKKLTEYYYRRSIPTYDECRAMLSKCQANERVSRHGQAVASVGCTLAASLNRAGLHLDLDLVAAGGLVHDLAKGKPNHSKRGGRLVKSMGFSGLSGIVSSHMDMDFTEDGVIDEAAIVFLADKLVQDDRRVTFFERFSPALERFSGSPEVLASITRRMRTAEAIGERTLKLLGINSFDELAV